MNNPSRSLVSRAHRQLEFQISATLAGLEAKRIGRGSKGRILIGPWMAEVGFELLYWIPFVRALGIDPARCVAISRGGVASWYRDIAETYIELHELFEPDELVNAIERRVVRVGDRKHRVIDELDRDAIARATEQLDESLELLHPSLMFRRFQPAWMGWRSAAGVLRNIRLAPIDSLPRPTDAPEKYVAVKLYSGDVMPTISHASHQLDAVLEKLVAGHDVVVLRTGMKLDDHDEIAINDRMVPAAGQQSAMCPSNNLFIQSCYAAHAETLVCTYGGFAYLGALCGTDTVALIERPAFNPVHERVLSGALERMGSCNHKSPRLMQL